MNAWLYVCPYNQQALTSGLCLQGSGLSMRPMHHNISFQGINLDSLFLGYQKEQVDPEQAYTFFESVYNQQLIT